MEQTLTDLKAGDEVAISGSDSYIILKIKEVSKRGIITLENGARYRNTNGSPMEKGEKWYRHESIQIVTEEIRQRVRQRKLARAINGLNINAWYAFDLETLEHIWAQITLARAKNTKEETRL